MRILFVLPGLHRTDRGAELAFISIARELAKGGDDVTLIGSGPEHPGCEYRYLRARSIPRERFECLPSVPGFRDECAYEELSFIPGLIRRYKPAEFDVTLTCSYPYCNWMLRRSGPTGSRPHHVFVTQNGDWPAIAQNSEYRFFSCDGLICTNPEFYQRNKHQWLCALIPNGVDTQRFSPGSAERYNFGLPEEKIIVLMVSALIPNKSVDLGVLAVSASNLDMHLVVAGDGPMREKIDELASELMPGRFTRLTVPPDRMPSLYRSADVFLHLADNEAFGTVYLEAMACGLPVVAPNSERLRWILGSNEFLLDSMSPNEITHHVEIAYNERLLNKMLHVKINPDFSWCRIASMYREFLQRVISQKNIF